MPGRIRIAELLAATAAAPKPSGVLCPVGGPVASHYP